MRSRDKAFLWILEMLFKKKYANLDSIEALRLQFDSDFGIGESDFDSIYNGVSRVSIQKENFYAEVLESTHAKPCCTILYLHGGGYCFGSLRASRRFAVRVLKKMQARVVVLEYPLAPENPYPAALNAAMCVYEYCIRNFSEPLYVMGDSAGGGLSVALTHRLLKLKGKKPEGLFLISPWLDLTSSGESIVKNAHLDWMLSPDAVEKFASLYAHSRDWMNPEVSPLFGDFNNFPKVYACVGTHEILLSDATRLEDNIRASNGYCDLKVFDGLPHDFLIMCPHFPESEEVFLSWQKAVQ